MGARDPAARLVHLDLNEFFGFGSRQGALRAEPAFGERRIIDEAFDPGEELANGFAVEEQGSGDEDGMRDHGAAPGAHIDFGGASGGVKAAEFLHGGAVEDFVHGLAADVADGGAIEHVALAAGVDIARVLDVHGSAPEVVAGVREVGGLMSGLGVHEVGFVLFDANEIDAGNGFPVADEVVDFGGVLLHADHLDDDLDGRLTLVLHAAEAQEVVADFLEAGAFAVELIAFLGGAVDGERDVFEAGVEDPGAGGFVEEGAVGREQRGDVVLFAVLDAIEDPLVHEGFAEPDEHHVFGGAAGFLDEAGEDFFGHVLLGLFVGLAGTHRAVEIALGRRFDDVFDGQGIPEVVFPAKVARQEAGAIPQPHER